MPEPRTLTVKSVNGQEPWSNDHGHFVGYALNVEEFEDEVTWNRRTSADAPKPGEQITGEVTQTDHGLKFTLKKASGGAPGGTVQIPQVRDDVTGRSIERQVSAKATAELLGPIVGTLGSADKVAEAFSYLFDRVDGKVRGEA